jgi:hypothetical protein
LCPAGQICDSMGLGSSQKSCPMGYYCLNTTKASSIEGFQGQSETSGLVNAWIQDGVTGAVYFNQTAYNWDYVEWPAPAVGRSRPMHPPASQCDGYDCFPGSSSITAETTIPCPIGFYCRGGAGALTPIPKNFSTPQRCFDGYFCPRGSVNPEGIGPCPTGYFCPTQIDALACPSGHYCPGVGNRAPIECYPGTYNPFIAMSNCTVCPLGHICPGWGLLLPELCPAGFACGALGSSFPVSLCPQGYFCGEGTLTLDPSDPTDLKPIPCAPGVFCLGGVYKTMTIAWIPTQPYGSVAPQVCSEGTYCQTAAYLPSGSGLCFKGHYCPESTIFPFATPIGSFAPSLGAVAPTLCFPGTYAPLESQTNCLLCPAGHTCQSYGTYIPSICPVGTYRSMVDSVTCVQCQSGTYSFFVGATDMSMCQPCPQGRVCGTQMMSNLNQSAPCPEGYLCGYATDLSRQFAHRAPGGYYSALQTAPSNQLQNICKPGFYCVEGTSESLSTNARCSIGSFCPASTPFGLVRDVTCPVLTTSLSGAASISQCIISAVDVCDKSDTNPLNPMEDYTYYPTFSYKQLDETGFKNFFDSSTSNPNPTGEVRVVKKIMPVDLSASTPVWVNDTIEAFRSCPQYGSGDGGDYIMIIGRNFRDTNRNYCRWRSCISSNSGETPRKCLNNINRVDGSPLPIVGEVSDATFITPARYISSTRMECQVPEFVFNTTVFYPLDGKNKEINACQYIDANGVSDPTGTNGNYSFVR